MPCRSYGPIRFYMHYKIIALRRYASDNFAMQKIGPLAQVQASSINFFLRKKANRTARTNAFLETDFLFLPENSIRFLVILNFIYSALAAEINAPLPESNELASNETNCNSPTKCQQVPGTFYFNKTRYSLKLIHLLRSIYIIHFSNFSIFSSPFSNYFFIFPFKFDLFKSQFYNVVYC